MLHLITHVNVIGTYGQKYRIPRKLVDDFNRLLDHIDSAGDRREGDRLDMYWEEFHEEFDRYEV